MRYVFAYILISIFDMFVSVFRYINISYVLSCIPGSCHTWFVFTKLLIIRVHPALAAMRSACMVHPPLCIDRTLQFTDLSASRRDTILVLSPLLPSFALIYYLDCSSHSLNQRPLNRGIANFNEFVSPRAFDVSIVYYKEGSTFSARYVIRNIRSSLKKEALLRA